MHGRGRDEHRQASGAAPVGEPVSERRRCRRAPPAAASSGASAVMIETANSPCGSWKNVNALEVHERAAVVPFARTSTTQSAIWFATT